MTYLPFLANESCSTERNQTASPLLRLPPEMRNRIYRFVLQVNLVRVYPQSAGVQFCTQYHREIDLHPADPDNDPREPDTFRFTCRQIVREVGDLYFALNTFKLLFDAPDDFDERHFTLTSLKRIRSVVVRVYSCGSLPGPELDHLSRKLLKSLAVLKSLGRVKIIWDYCCSGGFDREQTLEESRRVFESSRKGDRVQVILQ